MIKAKYTMVLKTIMDDAEGMKALNAALSDYPMYTPTNEITFTLIPTRDQLNTMLLNKYKYREIGFETVGRFLDELKTAMHEIMPYYYQLFKTSDILNSIDDPFGNVDITETFEQTTAGTASTNVEDNTISNDRNVVSDTPASQIDVKHIDNIDHASQITWNGIDNESNSKSDSETSGTTSHTLTRKGNQGVNTYAHDLEELKRSFQNITQEIINDVRIQELFMQVY